MKDCCSSSLTDKDNNCKRKEVMEKYFPFPENIQKEM